MWQIITVGDFDWNRWYNVGFILRETQIIWNFLLTSVGIKEKRWYLSHFRPYSILIQGKYCLFMMINVTLTTAFSHNPRKSVVSDINKYTIKHQNIIISRWRKLFSLPQVWMARYSIKNREQRRYLEHVYEILMHPSRTQDPPNVPGCD